MTNIREGGINFDLLVPFLTQDYKKHLAQKASHVAKDFALSESACKAFRNTIRTHLRKTGVKYIDKDSKSASILTKLFKS